MDDELVEIPEDSWQKLMDTTKFLKPFDTVTRAMSASKYPTLSAVIPLFNRLLDHLDTTIKYYGTRGHINKV